MRVELLFPSKYLRAADLRDRDVPLTIKDVTMEELRMHGGRVEKKPVVHFDKTEKMLVLNKTNATTISKLHGNETDAWRGKSVVLFPTRVTFGRETVDAIRVRHPDGSTDFERIMKYVSSEPDHDTDRALKSEPPGDLLL